MDYCRPGDGRWLCQGGKSQRLRDVVAAILLFIIVELDIQLRSKEDFNVNIVNISYFIILWLSSMHQDALMLMFAQPITLPFLVIRLPLSGQGPGRWCRVYGKRSPADSGNFSLISSKENSPFYSTHRKYETKRRL